MTRLTAIRATETTGNVRVGTLSLSGSTAPARLSGRADDHHGRLDEVAARGPQDIGRADRLEEARITHDVLGADAHQLVEGEVEALPAVRPAVEHKGSGQVCLGALELV